MRWSLSVSPASQSRADKGGSGVEGCGVNTQRPGGEGWAGARGAVPGCWGPGARDRRQQWEGGRRSPACFEGGAEKTCWQREWDVRMCSGAQGGYRSSGTSNLRDGAEDLDHTSVSRGSCDKRPHAGGLNQRELILLWFLEV